MPTVDEMVRDAKLRRMSSANGRKARSAKDWIVKTAKYPELNAATGSLKLPCTYRPPKAKT